MIIIVMIVIFCSSEQYDYDHVHMQSIAEKMSEVKRSEVINGMNE